MATDGRLRHAVGVAARAIAAILGGYALAALTAVAAAVWLPLERPEAVLTGMLASFAIYAAAVTWVFAAASAARAWAGLLLPAVVLGGLLHMKGHLG
jgi:Protein of unknown function (DUF3649)